MPFQDQIIGHKSAPRYQYDPTTGLGNIIPSNNELGQSNALSALTGVLGLGVQVWDRFSAGERAAGAQPYVVPIGGGVPIDQNMVLLLLAAGVVVYLVL